MFSQVQDLKFIFAELHKVLFIPLFQSTQIFLQDGFPLQCSRFSSQFAILGKLHQGAPDPIIQIGH